jgi:2-polyprenyl-3-methyl-5-hydroxy-6-metoxy-1,4-benzoquinol methylase
MNKEVEFAPCNFCGVDESKFLFHSSVLRIVKCKKCGLVYTNPRLSQNSLATLYNKVYFNSPNPLTLGYEDYVNDFKNIMKTFEKRWTKIEKYLGGPSKILDIGCAYGFLLKCLKVKGHQPYGIDVSEYAVKYAKEKFGLNATNQPLREIKFPDNYFDVVTIWDVIEHFTDPKSEILEIHRILKPNGILSIITPDSGSLQAKIWGKKWVEYVRPEEHLFFFSKSYLIDKLKSVGFEVISETTAGKYVTIKFILDRLKAYNKPIISILEKIFTLLDLTEKVVYCDPKDKMFVNFRKK